MSVEVTRDLLLKYDKPGPRYTSYPTAPEWRESFDDAEYRAALARAAAQPGDPLSIYVHLPFCWERCLFCGCNVVISKRQDVSEKYLEYLFREISMAAEALGARNCVKQLHWGGGTPTYLTPEQMRALVAHLRSHFEFDPQAEIALEADPRVTSEEHLITLRELGFNRISMGVQDLDQEVQSAIGRCQTEGQTRQLFDLCRKHGFDGINIDLIYGLPEQNIEGWERTIRAVIDIHPDRLAVYSYAHLPNIIKHQRRIDALPRPVGPDKYDLFALARKLFVDHGYRAIGMDHFALPTDELSQALDERRLHRNFMGYTVVPGTDMIGFGTSAIGEIGGAYAQNEKRPVLYYHALDEGRFPTMTGITLTEDDKVRRWLIRQLMCNFYLSFAELEQRFGVQFDRYFAAEAEDLEPFYRDGFLERTPEALHVLPLGEAFVRNISMVFDAHLKKPESHRQFSRTV